MAFIKATETTKVTIFKGWKITKVNNGILFVKTNNPFEKAYTNGFLDIIDIFGRHILLNTTQCIDMVEIEITQIVNDHNITQYYEGTPEVRTNYTASDDYATPIKENETNKICG